MGMKKTTSSKASFGKFLCMLLIGLMDSVAIPFYALSGKINENLNKQYLFVTRENEYVVLQYYIGSQFINEWFYNHFPSPEILLYTLMGINCIAVCVLLTAMFAKDMRA